MAEDAAESFLGHLIGFFSICLRNIGRTVREMWSVGARESEVTGFYIGRGKHQRPGACEERGLGYPGGGATAEAEQSF